MKTKTVKRMLTLMLATITSVAALSGCGQEASVKTSETTKNSEVASSGTTSETEKAVDKSKLPVLSLYPYSADLTSGPVTGWRSDQFAENGFQMEVWAYSQEKTNAILASGDLPDIMYVARGEILDTLIQEGKILKLEDYLDKLPNLYKSSQVEGALEAARLNASAGTGEVYGLPLNVGISAKRFTWFDSTDRNVVKLRWDVYEEIGAPEINDYWDLIDVMEQMLAAHPTEADGTKCYGTVLDNGEDGKYFGAMSLFFKWQGYSVDNAQYMLECDFVADEFATILSKDSKYYEGLKWYNEAYRRGLIDPDSINTDRATQAKKIDENLVMVPSGTLPGYAPDYFEYYIPETNIYYSDVSKSSSRFIVINAETEHLEECLQFLDMMCNPDEVLRMKYGPDGDIWYSDGENVFFTEEYLAWIKAGNGMAGFPMSDGTEWSLWNTQVIPNNGELTSYKDGNGNYRPLHPDCWTENQEIVTANENFAKWQETTGYTNWREWLAEEDAYTSGVKYGDYGTFLSATPDDLSLTISALRDIVVTSSWNMVYAANDEEFEAIWDKMVKDAYEVGAQAVMDWRLADIDKARKDVLGE